MESNKDGDLRFIFLVILSLLILGWVFINKYLIQIPDTMTFIPYAIIGFVGVVMNLIVANKEKSGKE